MIIYDPINIIHFDFYEEISFNAFTHNTPISQLPVRHYHNIEEIVEEINSILPDGFRGRLSIDKNKSSNKNRVRIILFEREIIKFNPTLAKMLGFNESILKYSTESSEIRNERRRTVWKAERVGDLKASLFNIYIYSNIVRDQIVGNQLVPLLRTISLEGKEGEYVHKIFDSLHYLDLSSDFFQHIEIKLANDLGELIRFQTGKVIVKLHFRKKHFWL